MARPSACRGSWQNFPPNGKEKLTGTVLTEGSGTITPTLAGSHAFTSTFTVTPAITLSSDNKLFKQFIKAYLKAQIPAQIALEIDQETCEQLFKARFPDFYFGNLHMDCY